MSNNRKIFLISGAPCSGKTYFIQNNLNDSEFLNCTRLSKNYKILNANMIRENYSVIKNNSDLVIHYDCLRSYKRELKVSVHNDKVLKFINKEKEVSVFIINTDVEILKKRMNNRINRLRGSIPHLRLYKLKKVLSLYQNNILYEKEINKWIEYCKNKFDKNKIFLLKIDGKNKFEIKNIP